MHSRSTLSNSGWPNPSPGRPFRTGAGDRHGARRRRARRGRRRGVPGQRLQIRGFRVCIFSDNGPEARNGAFARAETLRGDLSRREGLHGLQDSLFRRFGRGLPEQRGGGYPERPRDGDFSESVPEKRGISDFEPFGLKKSIFEKYMFFLCLFRANIYLCGVTE